MRATHRGLAVAVALALWAAGCGSGSSAAGTSTDGVCAFDGAGGSLRMESGSSHAHIWRDLTLDLGAGRLTGRVSTSVRGQPSVTEIDETVDASALSALQTELRATCGALASAAPPPDDVAGGSTTLSVEASAHGRFALVGSGLTSTVPAGTRVLEVSREDYLEVIAAFPEPGSSAQPEE